MKKELLYILIYLKNDKLHIKNIKNINEFEAEKTDLFIYLREEFFFEGDINDINDYYDIPNVEELSENNIKKLFITTKLVELNIKNIVENIEDYKLKNIINELYDFYTDDLTPISLDDLKLFIQEEQLKE